MKEITYYVFDESFYQKIKDKNITYKIYFHGYSENNYVGKLFDVDRNFLEELRKKIWVTYFGLVYGEEDNNSIYMDVKKFEKLPSTKRLRLEDLMKANRHRMIDGLYSNFFNKNQVKFIKMFYFMELHNLRISDLRFEVTYGYNDLKDVSLGSVQWKQILKDKNHLHGFNSYSIINKVFNDQEEKGPYCQLFFKDFEKCLNEFVQLGNVYRCWNMFWNFFEIFKMSFNNHIIYWLVYWNKLDFDTIKKQNEFISSILITEKVSYNFIYKPILIRQLTHIVKEIENLNVPYGFNDLQFGFLNELKLKRITYKNEEYLDIVSGFNLKEVNFNFFIENEFKWFLFRYENWLAKYDNISKYLKKFDRISTFFKFNPFLNSIYIEELLNEVKLYQTNFVYRDKNIYDEINKYVSSIYTGKKIENKKYDFINNFYLKEIHNIIIFILIYVTNDKYNDFIVLDNIFKI